MKTLTDIEPFASLLGAEQQAGYIEMNGNKFPDLCEAATKVKVTMAKKYARVDVGTSGKYMVDLETGEIYGIKGYGVIHRGHFYGTLDTIHEWDWSDYQARPKVRTSYMPAIN